jgi:hypothetical protein
MFYTQCDNCNERWELGTTNICTCVTNASATISVDNFSHLGQRTWVGLTDEEKNSFWKADQMTQKEWDELFSDIEAALKAKNT